MGVKRARTTEQVGQSSTQKAIRVRAVEHEARLDAFPAQDGQEAHWHLADALARGLGTLSANAVSVAWMFAERVDLAPPLGDYQTLYDSRVFSPTVSALCYEAATQRHERGVGVTEPGAEPLEALGKYLRQHRTASLDDMGLFLLSESNVHPTVRSKMRAQLDEILSAARNLAGTYPSK